MTFFLRLGFIVLLLFSVNVFSEEIPIKPSHPDQYTVVKNDTLWAIADKFLQHPWQWPLLWEQNSQIKNPNLIYPGDTLYFSMINGKPQLSLSRNSSSQSTVADATCVIKEREYINGRETFQRTKDGKLAQCIRESEIKEPIKLIPNSVIAKFLTSSQVIGSNDLNNAPYVVGIPDQRVVAGLGDMIYVRSVLQPDRPDFVIYRAGKAYVSPETGETLGYEAQYIADVSLKKPGDPATLVITRLASEVYVGDRLMERTDEDVTLNYFARPPEHLVTASIISILKGLTQVGKGDVVAIDRGRRDGLQPGHVLEVLQSGQLKNDPYSKWVNETIILPTQSAGTLMVFRTFERMSYALVMEVHREIHLLDIAQTP